MRVSTVDQDPLLFERFYEAEEEVFSPFITPSSRLWGRSLPLKASLLSALLWTLSFILSYFFEQTSLSLFLLGGVYFLAGTPSLIDALEDLGNLNLNIDVLMTLAAFGSVVIGSPMEGGLLLVLFTLSHSMEELVETKAQSALRELHRLSPTKAWVAADSGVYLERSVKDVKVGDIILVKSGETVPLDGKVIQGTSSVNLVHLTGENLPVTKKPGDTVPAGGRNMEGALTLEVSHTSHDSTLSKIINLVTQAEEAKPLLALRFESLTQVYSTTIIAATALFALILPWWYSIPFLGPEGGLYRALAFLIAASPCALIIAIPIAYLSALGRIAKNGILIKGGAILDALSEIKTIAFDKTGTLTTGELELISFEGDDKLLALAYALELNTLHPIAKAIQKFAEAKGITPAPISAFKTLPGSGLEALDSEGNPIYVGNTERLSPEKLQSKFSQIEEIKKSGDLIAVMTYKEQLYLFRFQDTPRPHAKESLQSLQEKHGLSLVMLSGDHRESAQKIAHEMGIEDWRAELKPQDKLNAVSELSLQSPLAFVGDGLNDAPALARALVGISMGKGASRAAIDAADVVLLHDNLEKLGWLFDKAQKTQTIVKQNLVLATLAIFAAALPALMGWVPLWLAVVTHEGGTILVGLNGLRLLKK